MNGLVRTLSCLALIAGLLGLPTSALSQGTTVTIPRTNMATLQSVRPVGQQFIVRFSWGGPLAESQTPGCVSYRLMAPGRVPAATDLPSGVFVQLNEGNVGMVQGLQSGDQVDVVGLVGWATCASSRASDLGWLSVTPSRVVRVAEVGQPVPPEPALDFGGSTGPVGQRPAPVPAATSPAAPVEPVGYDATVHLKDGNVLSGRVVEESLNELSILIGGREMTIDKASIAKVERAGAQNTPAASSAAKTEKPKKAPPPRKTEAEKAQELAKVQGGIQTAIGGGLLAPGVIFLVAGSVHLIGGIAYSNGDRSGFTSLDRSTQQTIRTGLWPAGVAGFWGGGFPLVFIGSELLKQGVNALKGETTDEFAAGRRRPVRAAPWLMVGQERMAFGLSGEF